MRQRSTNGGNPASAESSAKQVSKTQALAEEAQRLTKGSVALVRAAKEQDELFEEQVSSSISARDQAGNVAGVAYIILMFFCFVYLAYEGGAALWEDVTTQIAETEIEMNETR